MRSLSLCAWLALMTTPAVVAQRADDRGNPASKLSTVLADLAGSVAQETGLLAARSPGAAARLPADAMPRSVRDAVRGGLLRLNANNEVQVYILMSAVSDDSLRQVTEAGATIEIQDPGRRRVQARVPAARLYAVAGLPIVDAVRLPTYGRHRAGQVTTEGDGIVGAAAARNDFSLDGAGVRVGVISDGLKGVFETGCTTCTGAAGGPIAAGDLPATTGTRNARGVLTATTGGVVGRSFQANGDLEGLPAAGSSCGFAGAGAEGTALLEIVHDIAPAAKLSFANADTELAFVRAVNFLAASNDVVLDDVGFFGEPYDGTSLASSNTAAALNNPGLPLRAYFTSVGNDADQHYFGAYVDSGVDLTSIASITTPGHLHLFQRTADTTDVLGLGAQPYDVVQLQQNGEIAIFLTWDDPFGASGNNYDLYLVRESTGQAVASSRDAQNGRQDPVESVDYVNTGAADRFRIVIQNVQNAAQPRHLNLFSFQPECATSGPQRLAPPRHERLNYNTPASSVAAQSDAGGSPVSVVSVGAVCSASASASTAFPSSAPDESCNDTAHRVAEFFSSRGPTLDGRVKPDLVAVDGVSVTGAGGFTSPFFGTSAASPHAGAVAALVLQSAPCLLGRTASAIDPATARGALRRLIVGSASPLSAAPPDNVFGAGLLDAFAAVQKTLPAWKGSGTSLTVAGDTPFGASLTPQRLGFVDPNSCGLTSLSWSGGCGTSPGATMTCPFGTSTVTASASNNGVTFSSSTDLQITVTDFSVDVSPASAAVSPGQSARFVVSVAPQGGAFNSPVVLDCNAGALPPQTTCTFDPPAVTPGASPARSTLTLTTSTGSALGPAVPDGLRRAAPPPVVWLSFAALLALLWIVSRSRAGRIGAGLATAACGAGVLVLGGALLRTPAVSAAATASGIAVFPSGLDFGSQVVNTTPPARFVTITNVGADPLNVAAITANGDFSEVNNCGTTLPSGATCQVSVTFSPTASGARTGALTIVDNAPGSPHSISLAGTGVSAPASGGATPAGSFTITIIGTAGTLTHAASPTLVVQ